MTSSGQGTRVPKTTPMLEASLTEPLRAEPSAAELRQIAEKYSRMIQASPDAITLRSFPERRYIEVNDGFTRLTGYTAAEVIGKTPAELRLWVIKSLTSSLLSACRVKGKFAKRNFASAQRMVKSATAAFRPPA